MNYVTTAELAKMWNISTRMIIFYCEDGRIAGAEKKGRAWLIPANAQKPADKRKAVHNTLEIDENIAIQGKVFVHNQAEADNREGVHLPGDIYRHLGLTRETLRYYEKIGLIEPSRQIENLYREFDFYDVLRLLKIDFLKNRGFNLPEIKDLLGEEEAGDVSAVFQKKVFSLEENIFKQRCILNRLKKTRDLHEYALRTAGKFEIRDFPLYRVLKSFEDASDISNYGEKVLRKLQGEDILSHLVRAISVDETGYTGSKHCIVKPFTGGHRGSKEVFLESGRCVYTVEIVSPENADSFLEKMFITCEKWMIEQDLDEKGMIYVFCHSINKNTILNEMWIPIE